MNIIKTGLYVIHLGVLLVSSAGFAAENKVPQNFAQDLKITELEKFSLKQQLPPMAGYDIRARRIIVKPGGKIPAHDHATRPGIVYVESGSITEFRGDNKRLLKAGDSLVEDASTVHSYHNASDQPCVLIAFDLPASN